MNETELECPVAVVPSEYFLKSSFQITIPFSDVKEENRVVVGYASVDMLDKQNEVITLEALKDAFPRFMESGFNITGVMHSNFPSGRVLEEWEDSGGQMWKSGCDEQGLFIVSQVRDDVKRADEVWELIKQDRLKAYSIGGQAIIKIPVCDDQKCYWRIDKLDIHEISYVDNPANPGSRLAVLKMESLLKSEEFDLQKLAPVFDKLRHAVVSKDFICIAGSQVEEHGGYELFVRGEDGSPFRGHIESLVKEMVPDMEVGVGELSGDFVPLYDLVLLRRNPELVKVSVDSESLIISQSSDNLEQYMPNDKDKKPKDKEDIEDKETKAVEDKDKEDIEDKEKKAIEDKDKEEDDSTAKAVEVSPILLEVKAQLDKLAQDIGELKATKAADKEEDEEKPKDEEKKADVKESGDLEIPKGAQEQEQPVVTELDATGAKEKPTGADMDTIAANYMTKEDADAYIQKQIETQLKDAVEKLTSVEKRTPGPLDQVGDVDISTRALADMSWDEVHRLANELGATGRRVV